MEKEKGKSQKGGKWYGNQGANEQSGNFAKPILKVAILRSHVLKVANIQFSRCGRREGRRGEGMNRGKRRAYRAGVGGIRNPSGREGSHASACGREEWIWPEGRKHRREESSWVCCTPMSAGGSSRNRPALVAAARVRGRQRRK